MREIKFHVEVNGAFFTVEGSRIKEELPNVESRILLRTYIHLPVPGYPKVDSD
jgi:hypothetical protein